MRDLSTGGCTGRGGHALPLSSLKPKKPCSIICPPSEMKNYIQMRYLESGLWLEYSNSKKGCWTWQSTMDPCQQISHGEYMQLTELYIPGL